MRQIPVEEASVGDTIAAPLHDGQGRTLLPKGARLPSAVLSRLKGWGVNTITIEGEETDNSGKSPAELLEELDYRFADVEDDPLMAQIKDIARGHLLAP